MDSRFARSVAAFAGIHILGGHWLALQLFAWMGMFAVNSRDAGFADAIGKTFDGKHPCPLCLAVDAGKQKEKEEQEKQLVDTTAKAKSMPLQAFSMPVRSGVPLTYFETAKFADPIAIPPPSPPPWQA